ncbi:glycosyltransferase [Desulforegula conservatrix]|uniref:glycosyltransferase n=1 Tax=Desulforegula conservatrix TaxID=153026 RepID=UPI0003FBD7E3|nr:glycosyltransferase [Desulforegula conservatrix]
MKAICRGYSYVCFSNNNLSANHFDTQSLKEAGSSENTDLWFTSSGLGSEISIPDNLFEKMAWAILTRPYLDLLIQPLYILIETGVPEITENLSAEFIEKTIETGFIAVFTNHHKNIFKEPRRITSKERSNPTYANSHNLSSFHDSPEDFIRKALKSGLSTATLTRPVFEAKHKIKLPEKKSMSFAEIKSLIKDKARTSLSPEIRMHLKNLIHLIKPENPYNIYPAAEPDIAVKKSWESGMDDISIAVRPADTGERIPVLMVMHWLEVSGAERFAIELVRHLPKYKFAVYLITDVASDNPWEYLVKDHVEEIFHLPDFLERNLFKSFYVHFLKSRKIKLVHINHAPEFYRSLAHIRRFNTKVKIMDSLYIIELPPIPGGYPDYSARFAEPFLDMHHVACIQIKDFLGQRWHVPENKMTLIYLNVDVNEFDPAIIPAGVIRDKYNIPDSACVVAFLGRFVEQKRPLVFVEAVAQMLKKLPTDKQSENDICFIMAGSGYLDEKVIERIKKLGLEDKIKLTGNISELKSFYRDIDLLVMPSANEGVALVTFESMAMETPLVFADVGAQSELLPAELLVPDCKDEKKLADRFAQKCLPLILSPDKRAETGKGLRRHILGYHTDQMTYSDFERLYDQLCGK